MVEDDGDVWLTARSRERDEFKRIRKPPRMRVKVRRGRPASSLVRTEERKEKLRGGLGGM